MKKIVIGLIAIAAIVTSCTQSSTEGAADETQNSNNDAHHDNMDSHEHHGAIDMNATYTFVSVSTAKPGKLDDLVRIASSPSELMDEHVDGLLARQVSVDTSKNTVVVWVTFDKRESMMEYLNTEQGQDEHGDEDMDSILETFTMYDLTPKSQRLIPKH